MEAPVHCRKRARCGRYATPQGLRNVLLISATPYQWKHIISSGYAGEILMNKDCAAKRSGKNFMN